MENQNYEQRLGNDFEKIGKSAGKLLDLFSKKIGDLMNANPLSPDKADFMQQLVSYFINTADKENIEDMKIQNVLDWVDANYDKSANADKVYIVKGVTSNKKIVFCVFFGHGNEISIKEDQPKKCFVTSVLNDEMKQTFKDNNICEIPLN